MQHCFASFPQFGAQIFKLNGCGLPPTPMEPIPISAKLSSSSMHVINFTNPLEVPTRFSFTLKGDDINHFFLLIKHPQSMCLQPKTSIDIPVMFSPESMYKHQVTVVITAENHNIPTSVDATAQHLLCWEYPILGYPEFRPYTHSVAPEICCCMKERIEKNLKVVLVNSTSKYAATLHPVTAGELQCCILEFLLCIQIKN